MFEYLLWKCKYQGPEKFGISFFKKGQIFFGGFAYFILMVYVIEIK